MEVFKPALYGTITAFIFLIIFYPFLIGISDADIYKECKINNKFKIYSTYRLGCYSTIYITVPLDK